MLPLLLLLLLQTETIVATFLKKENVSTETEKVLVKAAPVYIGTWSARQKDEGKEAQKQANLLFSATVQTRCKGK